ncbi:helix-turn-helix transcriptional regulator [Chromobacterium piscinae]|uniref:helix-turn-helix transcriptional regulator n=1 Tax=Chromobacterium TaxID=535 RepID=UPI001E330E08|nr:helix-turn-helix transcriptional regulator [Chromobacterium piscinae]MCD5330575.1 helix-turn-helix transcriptional regulator [Chromobacterium piscinae]
MELHDFLRLAQRMLSRRQPNKLTQRHMATLINISPRTYVEYVRGIHRPKGMKALLDLLCLMDQEDRESLLQAWRTGRQRKAAASSEPITFSQQESDR